MTRRVRTRQQTLTHQEGDTLTGHAFSSPAPRHVPSEARDRSRDSTSRGAYVPVARSRDLLALQASLGNDATTALIMRGAASPVPVAPRVNRESTGEERRRLEERTGPLVTPSEGPPRAAVTDATRSDLENDFEKDLETWRSAAQTAIGDFVRDHDHERSYRALAFAVLAAPLGPLGVGLTGAAAVSLAVASSSVAVIASVPAADDRIEAFRDKMRQAYNNVAANRENSSSAIVQNYLLGITPREAGDPDLLRRRFTAHCFSYVLGTAVDADRTADAVKARLDREWQQIERERAQREVIGPKGPFSP